MLALVIEDQADIGKLYAETLSRVGFEVELIADGRLALERLQQAVPDFIVLDMNLPHVSGHYLLKQIRGDPELAEIPVLIATANAVMADALSGQLGDWDILMVKPVRPGELMELVRRIFPA